MIFDNNKIQLAYFSSSQNYMHVYTCKCTNQITTDIFRCRWDGCGVSYISSITYLYVYRPICLMDNVYICRSDHKDHDRSMKIFSEAAKTNNNKCVCSTTIDL